MENNIETLFMDEVNQRIKSLVNDGESDSAFARRCGIKQTTMSGYLNNLRLPNAENLKLIAEANARSLDWLVSGWNNPDLTGFTTVKKARPVLQGGDGNYIFEIDDRYEAEYHFKSDWLWDVCQPNHAVLFDVDGRSMEKTIRKGDIVLIDQSQKEIVSDHIYAIAVKEGQDHKARIKRILWTDSGKLKLKSDNPDFQEYDETLESSNVSIIGRCVWHGGKI